MSVLASRLIEIHDALSRAKLPHAFGGAIALAYCTEEPRGTRDLDVNVFVRPELAKDVFAALPDAVARSAEEIARTEAEGQVRLWWQDTPIDIFLSVHPFHDEVAKGVREVPFSGRVVPVLGCTALAVFKALLSRTKDWADIEEMVAAGEMNLADACGWVAQIVGAGDPAVARMRALAF
ncbi:MAG: hypothetical protein JWN81_2850 [Solirubrobacterales bacterium]|nr:hypothetical protein [Solirubrobacterales bacterium]